MTPDDYEERSAAERERARLEREARRAARERGEKRPREPGSSGGGLLGGLLGGRGGGRREQPPDQPAPADEPTVVQPAEPDPLQPSNDPPRRSPRDRAADRAAAARVALRTRRKRQEKSGAGPSAAPREYSVLFRIAAAAGVVAALVAVWFLWSVFQPLKGDGDGTVRVQIPTGAGVSEIAGVLEKNDVISSQFFFGTRVTLSGSRGDLKPGSYKLKHGMSYGAVIDALTEGPPRDIITVTIPEGRSRAEIAPIVKDAGLSGSYARASVRSSVLDPRRYRARNAKNLEGFLFPATYELKRNASAEDLVAKQLQAFKREFAGVDLSTARKKNLTPYDVLIIASMVEREAGVAKDRPVIASVIYNRLKNGIPLGIDATIRFAVGNWTEPLKQSELASSSLYNTRKLAGLPPGPIGNPGIDSIEAAANPAKTDYLYFVVKPCGEGEHVFSETFAQFQSDVDRYDAERAAQGGKSPTKC